LYCKNRAKSYGPFPHGGNSLNKWISTLPAIVELRVSYFYDIMQSSKKNTAERQTKKLRQHGTANRKTKHTINSQNKHSIIKGGKSNGRIQSNPRRKRLRRLRRPPDHPGNREEK
jgi:hypothetical protein